MKPIKTLLVISIVLGLFLSACDTNPDEDHNASDLTIEFSDYTQITTSDIEFYDSSTQIYFLKTDLPVNDLALDFNLKLDNDSILGGAFYSCLWSSPPATPYFISDCFFYGKDKLQIGYYGNGTNLLRDSRLINTLKANNLLRHGLQVQIDSIRVINSNDESSVICTFTIFNKDAVSYLIPDATKMGDAYFTDYTGNLSFFALSSGTNAFIKTTNSTVDRDAISLEDLGILEPETNKTFTYTSRHYYPIIPGEYNVRLRFMGIVYTANDFDLNQEHGRIWVGEVLTYKNFILLNE